MACADVTSIDVEGDLRKVKKEPPNHREYRPYRDYFSADVLPVIPGEVYPIDVEIWPTNVVVLPGEKVSIEISAGDTPGIGPLYMKVVRGNHRISFRGILANTDFIL
jgi:hypothetical protein